MEYRIVAGGILECRSEDGGLRKRERRGILCKVPFCSSLRTVAAGAKIYGIEIVFQNLCFGEAFFQLECKVLFLDLPAQAVIKGIFLCPLGKDAVFDQLLSDGAGTF